MKISKHVILATLVSLTSISAHAIDKGGNGGGAFICQDPSKSSFLDLYEAQESVVDGGLGLNIQTSNDPVETQIQNAFTRLNPKTSLYQGILSTYQRVKNASKNPVPAGLQLAWPSDEHNRYAPANCSQRGIIIYHDSVDLSDPDYMDIDTTSLESLSNTQQAAAWVHEVVYKFLRGTQFEINSVRTRQIVGYLFSDANPEQLNTALEVFGLSPNAGADHLDSADGDDASFGTYHMSYIAFTKGTDGNIGGIIQPSLRYYVKDSARVKNPPKCKSVDKLLGSLNHGGTLTCNTSEYCGVYDGEVLSPLFSQESGLYTVHQLECSYDIVVSDTNGNTATFTVDYVQKAQNLIRILPSINLYKRYKELKNPSEN